MSKAIFMEQDEYDALLKERKQKSEKSAAGTSQIGRAHV